MTATFAVIDFAKYKVTLPRDGDAGRRRRDRRDLDVGSDATVFAFLKQHPAAGAGVYMSMSYAAAA